MTLRVIGAGVGRTGTTSLKAALETLLGGRCYHMFEIRDRPDDVPVWHRALQGEMPDWASFLGEFSAAVDWPASAFWPELAAAFPAAVVVLSSRDAEAWWRSASKTIIPASFNAPAGPWREMVFEMFARRFTPAIDDHDAAIAAFEAHNARVRASGLGPRLIEWNAADGWAPLCAALGLAVPDTPFPHDNTTAEFLERVPRAAAAPDA
ncbi:MAG: sulfotransferase family protein [Planctomycetes bacterium]|nr:sulfotransferase family protein [Planctomycetota bacterium]